MADENVLTVRLNEQERKRLALGLAMVMQVDRTKETSREVARMLGKLEMTEYAHILCTTLRTAVQLSLW